MISSLPPMGTPALSDAMDRASRLLDAIKEHDLTEVERLVDEAKADPLLGRGMLTYRAALSAGVFQTPLISVFQNDPVGAETIEIEFKIADILIEAHRELRVSIFDPNLFKKLPSLEVKYGLSSPKDEQAHLELFQAFLRHALEAHIAIMDSGSPEVKEALLNALLVRALKEGLPELSKALLEMGADHTIVPSGKLLYDILQDRPASLERRVGMCASILSGVHHQRESILNSRVQAQLERLVFLFAWKETHRNPLFSKMIGGLPREVAEKIARCLSWKPINWPVSPHTVSRIIHEVRENRTHEKVSRPLLPPSPTPAEAGRQTKVARTLF